MVRRWALALLVPSLLVPALVVGSTGSTAGASATAGTATVMPLQEFVNDDAGGRLWNAYDQTVNSVGPSITGRASTLINGASVYVFARGANGDLTEFANDNAHQQLWNAYDVTTLSGGPAIVGDPAAIALSPTSFAVFAEANSGDLVEFTGGPGQSWASADISSVAFGVGIGGDPSALAVAGALDVFARSAAGHLLEFSGTPGGHAWTSSDLTTVSAGPTLAADPFAVLYGTSSVHVYAVATNGDLTEYVNDGAGGRAWNAYDLTKGAAGPGAGGRPAAVVYGTTVHVYVRAASGDLTEFVNDGAGGRLWNSYDLTVASKGPTIVGRPRRHSLRHERGPGLRAGDERRPDRVHQRRGRRPPLELLRPVQVRRRPHGGRRPRPRRLRHDGPRLRGGPPAVQGHPAGRGAGRGGRPEQRGGGREPAGVQLQPLHRLLRAGDDDRLRPW